MGPRGLAVYFGLLLVCCVFILAEAGAAQESLSSAPQTAQAPAHIGLIDGSAAIEREGRAETPAAGSLLVTGDRIRTSAGRLEIFFGDGSALHLDHHTTIDLLSESLVRLLDGRLAFIVSDAATTPGMPRYQVDTSEASVRIDAPGEYRIATFTGPTAPEVELAVVRGAAQLVTDRGSIAVRAGERSVVRDGQASFPQPFNSARWDAFDRWSQERQDARRVSGSSSYLPSELRVYGRAFDRYGTWGHVPQHGYVWYPTAVAGWRPYFYGYWNHVGPYGWTWIGLDPWSWPTHHYGRWGHTTRGSWYWIPGRRWAPAWVHWAVAPGYVSWCPIGFDGGPVIPFWANPSYGVYTRVFSPDFAWVVIPRHTFGIRTDVRQVAIDPRRVASDPHTRFVTQQAPPNVHAGSASRPIRSPRDAGLPPATAVPRSLAQPAEPSSTIGPRSTAPGFVTRPIQPVPRRDPSDPEFRRSPSAIERGAVPRTVAPGAGGIVPSLPQPVGRPSPSPHRVVPGPGRPNLVSGVQGSPRANTAHPMHTPEPGSGSRFGDFRERAWPRVGQPIGAPQPAPPPVLPGPAPPRPGPAAHRPPARSVAPGFVPGWREPAWRDPGSAVPRSPGMVVSPGSRTFAPRPSPSGALTTMPAPVMAPPAPPPAPGRAVVGTAVPRERRD